MYLVVDRRIHNDGNNFAVAAGKSYQGYRVFGENLFDFIEMRTEPFIKTEKIVG